MLPTSIDIPISAKPTLLAQSLRYLSWAEVFWVVLLGIPLTLPGHFLPIRYTPTIIFLLFIFWPLHGWVEWRHKSIRQQPFLIAIGVLLITLIISIAVADDLRYAWLMAAHLAFGIALCVALIQWPPTRRWPQLVAVGIMLIALVLSLIGPPLLGTTLHSASAARIFFTLIPFAKSWGETLNPNILAGGLLLAIPISFAWALMAWPTSWVGRALALLRSLLLLGITWWLIQILFLTDSRGALMAAAISCVLVLLLRWPQLTGPVLVLAFLGFIWLLFNDPWIQLNLIMANGMARDYNSRMEIWVRSWQAFRQHPLTGIGIGGFVPYVVDGMLPVRVPLTQQVTHAHNLLLQVAVDLGIFGLLAYLGCMVISGMAAVKAWHRGHSGDDLNRSLAGGILAALAALNLHGILDAPLWNSKLAFIPWMLFALAIILYQRRSIAPSTGPYTEERSSHGSLERRQKGRDTIYEGIV